MRDYDKMIKPFAEAMRIQMAGSDAMGFGFRSHIENNEAIPDSMFDELENNIEELKRAVWQGSDGTPSQIEHRAMIRECAADVANAAMLIALNTGSITLVKE